MANKAELIKMLRAATQAGMSDCMKAIEEVGEDLEAAQKWLREKGMAKANKKAGAVAYEGIVKTLIKDNKGLVVEVNCQTDFAAKNEQFIKLTNDIANCILEQAKNNDDISNVKVNNTPIADAGLELTAVTGEKMAFRRGTLINVKENQTLGYYTHSNNKIGVLILIDGKVSEEAAKDVAMHAAAMAPKFLNEKEVDKKWLDSEKEVLSNIFKEELSNITDEKAKEEKLKRGPMIVEGKVKKLLKEICLVDQSFVKEPSLTVAQFMKNSGGEIIQMVRYELGEGFERKNENFADEVAAQMCKK